MIFLVDGSWSIGHSHFQQVKDFLARVIEPFEIGPDKVQVGGSCPLPCGPSAVALAVLAQLPGAGAELPADQCVAVWPAAARLGPCGTPVGPMGLPAPGRTAGGSFVESGDLVSMGSVLSDPVPGTPFPGLTQYSGDPQTEWDLNTFGTKEEVLAAVRSLHYRGGNTFTGLSPQPLPGVGLPPYAPPGLANLCTNQAQGWVQPTPRPPA